LNREVSFALDYALKRGFQIHPDALEILERIDAGELERIIRDLVREKSRQRTYHIGQDDLEEFLGIKDDGSIRGDSEVLFDPTGRITSAEGVGGYNALFASRFSKLRRIVSDRPESRMIKPISGAMSEKSRDDVYVCGLVTERSSERNIVRLVMEDPTGTMEIIVFDEGLKEEARGLLLDQFVVVRAAASRNGGYVARDIILPDVPDRAASRSETEAYAVFLSDLHVGSRYFMEAEFGAFTDWLRSPDPIARRVRFVLIAGDVVDGVGIYPNQDKELLQPTIESQLAKLDEMLSGIPGGIKVLMITGNHDPGRRALPQPALPEKYNRGMWERENYHLLGNPAMVSLNGVKVLMFHGQSIDDIVKTTPGLSYDRPAAVMRHLIRARHMSPVYGSQTPIAPETDDMMVIDDVPDVFHAGHVHVVDLDVYRGTLLVNSGAWQAQTPFQSSVGVTPTPGVAVILNLKTFKAYSKNFSD